MRHYNLDQMDHIDRFYLTIRHMHRRQHLNMNFHDHDFSEIAVIVSANNTLHWCNNKSHLLEVGDVILQHPGTVHAYENTDDFEVINIIFEASQLPLPQLDGGKLKCFTAMLDDSYISPEPEKPLTHLNEPEFQEVMSRIEIMEKEISSDRPGSRLYVFGEFMTLLILIARSGGLMPKKQFDSSAMRALHYINLHYREPISMDFLSKLCNMSRSSFFSAFKQLSGYTPLEYQQQKRLELAENLLRSSHKNLSEIAYECGFCDSNYLSKLFKRKFATSPSGFRKQFH